LNPDELMNGHPQFAEDFELYTLGVLDGDDKAAFEAHLAVCAECRRELEGARSRASLLGLAAVQASPRPEVREQVLDRFRVDRRAKQPLQAPTAARYRRSPWTPLWAAAAVVLLVAAAWLERENRRLEAGLAQLQATHVQLEASSRELEEESARAQAALDVLTAPETIQVELAPVAARPVPHGKAFYNASKGLLFYAADLPALAAGHTYELWLIPSEGAPIDAGLFNADLRGNGEVILPALPRGLTAKAFAVTIEPAGGVPAPTGPKVLIGPVS
jgi:anti-sigma-K factor RskA